MKQYGSPPLKRKKFLFFAYGYSPQEVSSAISNAELNAELSPYKHSNFNAELQVINNVFKDLILEAKLDKSLITHAYNRAIIKIQYLK